MTGLMTLCRNTGSGHNIKQSLQALIFFLTQGGCGTRRTLRKPIREGGILLPHEGTERVNRFSLQIPPKLVTNIWSLLQAGAESGWDYSTRWFIDSKG